MEVATTTGVADLTRRIAALRNEYTEADKQHKADQLQRTARIRELEQRRTLALLGLPEAQRALAENIISVRGKLTEDAQGAFQGALDAIAAGGNSMVTHFVGVKRYGGFHQREDTKYGYGPRHGSIVMAIELRERVRVRSTAEEGDGGVLTEEERDACCSYLLARQKAERDGTWEPTSN